MTRFRYVVADVFTDTPFHGNQLAVFTDARGIPEELLQPIAREMNFSETVFVLPPEWRTRTTAHLHAHRRDAVCGSSHARDGVRTRRTLQLGELRLETEMGIVPVRLEREEGRIVFGRMEQPLPTVAPYVGEADLLAVLGAERSELPVEVYDNGVKHVYVTLGSKDEVAALRPDVGRLADLDSVLGINCIAGAGSRWKTRMFAPAGRGRGSGDGLRCGTARASPRPAWAHPIRRRDRGFPRRGGRPPVDAVRASRRLCGRRSARRGRRLGGDRRPRRAQRLNQAGQHESQREARERGAHLVRGCRQVAQPVGPEAEVGWLRQPLVEDETGGPARSEPRRKRGLSKMSSRV